MLVFFQGQDLGGWRNHLSNIYNLPALSYKAFKHSIAYKENLFFGSNNVLLSGRSSKIDPIASLTTEIFKIILFLLKQG